MSHAGMIGMGSSRLPESCCTSAMASLYSSTLSRTTALSSTEFQRFWPPRPMEFGNSTCVSIPSSSIRRSRSVASQAAGCTSPMPHDPPWESLNGCLRPSWSIVPPEPALPNVLPSMTHMSWPPIRSTWGTLSSYPFGARLVNRSWRSVICESASTTRRPSASSSTDTSRKSGGPRQPLDLAVSRDDVRPGTEPSDRAGGAEFGRRLLVPTSLLHVERIEGLGHRHGRMLREPVLSKQTITYMSRCPPPRAGVCAMAVGGGSARLRRVSECLDPSAGLRAAAIDFLRVVVTHEDGVRDRVDLVDHHGFHLEGAGGVPVLHPDLVAALHDPAYLDAPVRMSGHEGAHIPDLLIAPLEAARGVLRNDHLEVGVEGGLDAIHVPPVHRVDEAEHCVLRHWWDGTLRGRRAQHRWSTTWGCGLCTGGKSLMSIADVTDRPIQDLISFAEARIRVLPIAPTIIVTPGVQATQRGADLERTLYGPLGRAGLPDDVARVALSES